MNHVIESATLFNGFALGWSVAWPPGPVNAEIIRRGILPPSQGGGFWPAWRLGLGACTGDFIWALAVMTGAGAVLNTPRVREILGFISLALLLCLAGMFARGAWRSAHHARAQSNRGVGRKTAGGYLLGLTMTLTGPWNLGFWFAVIGAQQSVTRNPHFANSVAFAASVVLGAIVWTLVLSLVLKRGSKFFARPGWQIATQAITALLMLFFAARLLLKLI